MNNSVLNNHILTQDRANVNDAKTAAGWLRIADAKPSLTI
jgi:hypothetical protein